MVMCSSTSTNVLFIFKFNFLLIVTCLLDMIEGSTELENILHDSVNSVKNCKKVSYVA